MELVSNHFHSSDLRNCEITGTIRGNFILSQKTGLKYFMLSTEPNTPDNTTLNCKIMIVVLSHSKQDIRQGFNQLGFIKIKIKIQRTLKLYIHTRSLRKHETLLKRPYE